MVADMEEHGAFWAHDMSTAVPCFPTTWPSAHRLRTNHSTDGHGIKGGGAPYMHIRTEVLRMYVSRKKKNPRRYVSKPTLALSIGKRGKL